MKQIQKLTDTLKKHNFIQTALLFGSYAKGTTHSMSDIDIAIETSRELNLLELGSIVSEIETLYNQKVDLVILNDLYKKRPLLAYNIYQNHKLLFTKDINGYISFKTNALHYYMDFQNILEEQNKAFHKRVSDGNIAKTKTA